MTPRNHGLGPVVLGLYSRVAGKSHNVDAAVTAVRPLPRDDHLPLRGRHVAPDDAVDQQCACALVRKRVLAVGCVDIHTRKLGAVARVRASQLSRDE